MSLIFLTAPQKRLLQGITSLSTSFYINDILSFDGITNLDPASLGTQMYCAIRNDTGSVLELMEIDPSTIATNPITILKRGLSFYGDRTTENTALKLDWSANSIVMLGTDLPQIFQYLKEYVDAASFAGTVPATTANAGIVVEATQVQVDAGTKTTTISDVAYDNIITPDKVRAKKIQDYAADAGSTDAYAITVTPAPAAYAVGQIFTFKANTINTDASTLNVNSLGAKTIVKDYNVTLASGDILANQIVMVEYDGTNFQLMSRNVNPSNPTTQTFTAISIDGDFTTQFDITNPSGTTFRYTYDGSGTDPVINSTTVPSGTTLIIQGQNFASGNKGTFVTTGVGPNYFEITNVSGVAEINKAIGSGYIIKNQTWTKPARLKYARIKVQAAGGGSGSVSATANTSGGSGGGGGYSEKIVAASSLGATEILFVGVGGKAGSGTDGGNGVSSSFGSQCSATGGGPGLKDSSGEGGDPGIGSGGDLNLSGEPGHAGFPLAGAPSPNGGSSILGSGGRGQVAETVGATGNNYGGGAAGSKRVSGNVTGGVGAKGIVIVEEFYI